MRCVGSIRRSTLGGALWLCLGVVPTACWPAEALVAPGPALEGDTIVIRITLNSEDKGDFFVQRMPDGDFLVKAQDLKAMGFREPAGRFVMIEGEAHIPLRSMPGVSFEFREKELALNIVANAQLLSMQAFGSENLRNSSSAVEPNQSSVFVNYALSAARSDIGSPSAGFAGELGWRLGNYLFLSDASTADDAVTGKRSFVRLMSSVTHDDRAALRRTVVGDFFTPAREFSNGINVGGISVSKLYGLNPYFIQFPMQRISGNVALPSDLDVFVDGQRVRTERVKPGDFEVRDILAYGGARNVQLVLRDAFGRVQQLSYSFYFSDQPLRKGLNEYSYNIGALRRSFGIASNRYGPAASSIFHRYGFSDALTLGLRAEATRHLVNAGPTATLVLGSSGVVNVAAAHSALAGRRGTAALMSYTYQAKLWSAGISLRRDWGQYAMLADPLTLTNRKGEASISASRQLDQRGTISLSHSFLSTRSGPSASLPTLTQPYGVSVLENQRRTTLSYTVPLVSGWAALTARVDERHSTTEE